MYQWWVGEHRDLELEIYAKRGSCGWRNICHWQCTVYQRLSVWGQLRNGGRRCYRHRWRMLDGHLLFCVSFEQCETHGFQCSLSTRVKSVGRFDVSWTLEYRYSSTGTGYPGTEYRVRLYRYSSQSLRVSSIWHAAAGLGTWYALTRTLPVPWAACARRAAQRLPARRAHAQRTACSQCMAVSTIRSDTCWYQHVSDLGTAKKFGGYKVTESILSISGYYFKSWRHPTGTLPAAATAR